MLTIEINYSPISYKVEDNRSLYVVKEVLDIINESKIHLSHIKKVMDQYPDEFVRTDRLYVTRKGFLALVKYLRTEAAEEVFWGVVSGETVLP